MLNATYKNDDNYKEILSESHKNMWKRLRNNKEFYDNFCKKRSNYMIEAMKKGHLHYEKNVAGCKNYWDNLTERERKYRCNLMQNFWDNANEETRLKHSNSIKNVFATEENKEKRSKITKELWKDENYRNKVRSKMTDIMKNTDYREKMKNSLKEKWKDEDFLEKMKNRKSRPFSIIEITFPNGDIIIYNGISKMLKEYGFSRDLIMKYIDTDEYVPEQNEKYRNKYKTAHHKFKYIKRAS